MLFQYTSYSGAGRGFWQVLIDWGFVDALLPFLLIFIIIFGILQRIKLFRGEGDTPNRKINGILSMIIAAMVVVPHITGLYPPQSDPINLINQFLPSAAVILLAVLCVIILLGLAGGEIPSLFIWAVALVSVGILVIVILKAIIPGFFPMLRFLQDPAMQALIVVLLVIGLIGFFIIRDDTTPTDVGGWIKRWVGPPPT